MTGKLFRYLFYILVAYSIFIQFFGILVGTRTHWDSTPVPVDNNLHRLWDINDNPISRGFLMIFK
jgi:hypothetical protein